MQCNRNEGTNHADPPLQTTENGLRKVRLAEEICPDSDCRVNIGPNIDGELRQAQDQTSLITIKNSTDVNNAFINQNVPVVHESKLICNSMKCDDGKQVEVPSNEANNTVETSNIGKLSAVQDDKKPEQKEPELAFVEKKLFIPGLNEEHDDELPDTSEDTDFWKLVTGKSKEELAKEAEEEKEWLKSIAEEEQKLAEEERLKKLFEEVSKNEKSEIEESESEEEFVPPPVTDPKLIFDPAKVPEAGIIEPEYREVMGFVEIDSVSKKKEKKTVFAEIENDIDKTSVEVSDINVKSRTDAEVTTDHSVQEVKSIEELEAELIEEAKQKSEHEKMAENTNPDNVIQGDDIHIVKPITVQENKLVDTSVVYKIGIVKKNALIKKLPSVKRKDPVPLSVEDPVDKEAQELERLAMQELLSEAKRGAERAKELGPLGWQKSRVPETNKRFLINTIRGALLDPANRRRRRSRSHERRPSRSESRERKHGRAKSRERRSDGSRSRAKGSRRHKRRSRSRSDRIRRRSRSRSGSKHSRDSGSRSVHLKQTSDQLNSKIPPKNLEKSTVKPSKSSWSSDEDEIQTMDEAKTMDTVNSALDNDENGSTATAANSPLHEVVDNKTALGTEANAKNLSPRNNVSGDKRVDSGDDFDCSPRKKARLDNAGDENHVNIRIIRDIEVESTIASLNSIEEKTISKNQEDAQQDGKVCLVENAEQKNEKNTSRNGSNDKCESADDILDERTRMKLDIVETALREIEENPIDLDDCEKRPKKKKHKEHKKHKHKHKSKHKKKRR